MDSSTCVLSAVPTFPPTDTSQAAGLEHPPHEHHRRRLALGPGHRHDAPPQPAAGQLELADEGNAPPPDLVEDRQPGRHAGAQHHEISPRQRVGPVSAELELDAGVLQAPDRLGDLGAPLGQDHARAAGREELRRRHAAARRPHHHDRRAPHGKCTHRSFRVARLKQAKTTAAIRNRLITFGSLHPISSQ